MVVPLLEDVIQSMEEANKAKEGVVAATDNFDCLSRFVQLRGLPVFDEWLQELHRGKIGDDSGKSIEEFILVSLLALDKYLPIDLSALQMCTIGRSVNHLSTHKNLEIQKKARSLVDTWKKLVEVEMDAKFGSTQAVSWPARSRNSDVAMKSSAMELSASKAASVKVVQGETVSKSASASVTFMLRPISIQSKISPSVRRMHKP